jgi:hypothetical protein
VSDELVARHDPVVELFAVEDGGRLPCFGDERIGIGQIVVTQRIELRADAPYFCFRCDCHLDLPGKTYSSIVGTLDNPRRRGPCRPVGEDEIPGLEHD